LTNFGFLADNIVLHGESLGTAVATELACRRRCAALILESPFTSLSAMANQVVPFFGGVFVHGFDTLSRIKNVQVPKPVIHGEADDIVPLSGGERVFEAAKEPKEFWPVKRAGHNDLLYGAGDEYVQRLRELYWPST
jgi:fermentation-respiration switch protein FrsA (DUF1100 family)